MIEGKKRREEKRDSKKREGAKAIIPKLKECSRSLEGDWGSRHGEKLP